MHPLYQPRTRMRILTVCLLLITFCFTSQAQIYREIIENAKTRNFKEIQRLVENYYRDKDKGKGSGYKQWKRWEYFNSTRLDPQGNVVNIAQINLEQAQIQLRRRASQRIISSSPGSWQSL